MCVSKRESCGFHVHFGAMPELPVKVNSGLVLHVFHTLSHFSEDRK